MDGSGNGAACGGAIAEPLVVPIFHVGMQQLMPQRASGPRRGKVKSFVPRTGKKLLIRVGEPVAVRDILERHAPAVAAAQRARVAAGGSAWGPSGEAERALYHEVTARVEAAMVALQEEALEEYCETYGVSEFVFNADDEAEGGNGEGGA